LGLGAWGLQKMRAGNQQGVAKIAYLHFHAVAIIEVSE
jgi:hypothetical protein